jgi:regulator of replication initiation timing
MVILKKKREGEQEDDTRDDLEKKSVPLFVKLDKYKLILDIINDTKSILFFAKNTLNIQKQIERLLDENKKVLEDAILKIDEKIALLEKELTKPGVYEIKKEKVFEESKDLDKTLEELKSQIENLKEDLKNIA